VSREDNLRDCLAAYDRLIECPGVDPSAVGVVGSSYGGYLAAVLTSRRAVRWLGLLAPALYEDDGWSLPKRWLHHDTDLVAFRHRAVAPEENVALRAGAAFRGDVLLIESERDNVVPHPVIESYLSACVHARSLTYRVLEGADHGLSEEPWRLAYTTLLVSWLNEMTAGLRGPR
jgi:pimeloyl-ACP methyl ester carboxylesterase